MCCEQLVCAQCAGRVVEGRCGTCRAARAQLHASSWGGVPPQLLVFVVLLLVLAMAWATKQG